MTLIDFNASKPLAQNKTTSLLKKLQNGITAHELFIASLNCFQFPPSQTTLIHSLWSHSTSSVQNKVVELKMKKFNYPINYDVFVLVK